MTSERESMTLQEMDAPALGVAERRYEALGDAASHARTTPDPEVVAKPKKRKLERAVSTADAGVGRELHAARRGGPAASPRGAVQLPSGVMATRRFVPGSLQEPGLRSNADISPPSATPSARYCARARGESALDWKTSCTPPIRSWTSREKLPGCWDSASNTGRTADGRQAARIAGRRGAGVPSAQGATGFLLPSSEARSRASAAPSYARPGPVSVGTRARPRSALQPALRRPVTGRGPQQRCSTEGQYLCAERTIYRILTANQPVRERSNY